MNLHKEIHFEDAICEHLAANGWHYSAKSDGYDAKLAIFPEDVLAWIQETQPEVFDSLAKTHGAGANDHLLNRLRACLDQSGTLHVLRNGIDVLGLRKEVKLAQFKPALAMNLDIMQRYAANRLRIVRQVYYSQHNKTALIWCFS